MGEIEEFYKANKRFPKILLDKHRKEVLALLKKLENKTNKVVDGIGGCGLDDKILNFPKDFNRLVIAGIIIAFTCLLMIILLPFYLIGLFFEVFACKLHDVVEDYKVKKRIPNLFYKKKKKNGMFRC